MKKVYGCFIVFLLMQLSCFSALPSAESTPGYIWWEAEDAVTTDLTSEMTFSPANETEAKMLSGREWIGVGPQTKKGFAEYTVSVERAGTYKFYVRKFWKHGPFQWRFNEQSWQEVPFEVALLDSVTMRTHVGANWVFAGEVTLEAGEQTLRVELSGAPEGGIGQEQPSGGVAGLLRRTPRRPPPGGRGPPRHRTVRGGDRVGRARPRQRPGDGHG